MYRILKAGYKTILIILLTIVTLAILFSLLTPHKFKATSALLVNYKHIDPISGSTIPAQLIPSLMETEVDIIQSKSVAYLVVEKLQLQNDMSYQEDFASKAKGEGDIKDWIADGLLKNLVVTPSRSSSKIEITYKDKTPAFAAKVANAFSEAYIQKNIELKVDPSKKAASFYQNQLTNLKAKMEVASKKYEGYQRDNNILNINGSFDVETARMNELSTQLLVVQEQLAEAKSRHQLAANQVNISPDVSADPVVLLIKEQLITARAKISEIKNNYSENHPAYISASKEVKDLETELSKQMQSVSKTVSANMSMLEKRQNQLQQELAKQKEIVHALNTARNELSLIEQELESAKKSYNAASQRYSENNFEGESGLSNVSVLTNAVVPRKPYFPKRRLIVLASIFLGFICGSLYVLIRELFDRKLRSEEDMLSILDLPCFGELPKRELKKVMTENMQISNFSTD